MFTSEGLWEYAILNINDFSASVYGHTCINGIAAFDYG